VIAAQWQTVVIASFDSTSEYVARVETLEDTLLEGRLDYIEHPYFQCSQAFALKRKLVFTVSAR
jgi:hypothetical protein